jgi:hypothetical protein
MRRALGAFMLAAAVAAPPAAGARDVPAMAVRTAITPASAAVGQQVAAIVQVAVDPSLVDPSTVRIDASAAPLDLERQARSVSTSAGLAVVTERLGASCLNEACLPVRGPVAITLPPVRATARARDGTGVAATATWPSLQVAPRVTQAAASPRAPAWQVQHDLPSLTTRISPRTLERVFTIIGVAFAVAAGVLLAAATGRRAPRAVARPAPTLADALASVRRAAQGRSVADRRVALDLLARMLTGSGNGQAARARDLAWSEARPTSDRMESLALEVEHEEAAR